MVEAFVSILKIFTFIELKKDLILDYKSIFNEEIHYFISFSIAISG